MRVAHLIPNLIAGGRERFVAELCRMADIHGIEPIAICYDPFDIGSEIAGGGLLRCPLDRAEPRFSQRLNALLAELRIDILHCQGHIAAALAGSALDRVPSVTTLHVSLGSGWRWLPAIVRGLRASRRVCAVSADLARSFGRWADKPISIIPPGVDLQQFAPVRQRASPGEFTLGIAARLHPVKRHRDALEAMRILAGRGQRCRLVVAGEGTEEAALRRAAAGLEVEFVGHVADMAGWFAKLDAFVLPSDHEGAPLALLEAMACGLPCIASAVGGIPALVDESALLVARRKPNEIAAQIARLIDDSEERLRLGRAARNRAECFSHDRLGSSYAGLYRSLVTAT